MWLLMSPPTQCDNYCRIPQLSSLLGFYALCYSGQGEGLTYKTLYFLKEPINIWSSDPSFFMPWHHLPSTSCHEQSQFLPMCGGQIRTGIQHSVTSTENCCLWKPFPNSRQRCCSVSLVTPCVCQPKRGSSKQEHLFIPLPTFPLHTCN